MNYDLGKTQITNKIRVSSAAIQSSFAYGEYYQYETWIFSDDPKQKNRQIIHGTTGIHCGLDDFYTTKTRKIHAHIAKNLISKYEVKQ